MKASAYESIAGKTKVKEELLPEHDETKVTRDTNHVAWLHHPNTIKLLEFLNSEKQHYLDQATNLAVSGSKKQQITKCLIKAATIQETINYASSNKES